MEIGNSITQVLPNLWAIEPDPDEYAEAYTRDFSSKLRQLLNGMPLVGAIPDLQQFIESVMTPKTIPLALKNSIFFQSILDADNFLAGVDSERVRVPSFDIIVADFPPTGNMIALFEIPQNHVQALLKYSLEVSATVATFVRKLRKVTKVFNPLTWGKQDDPQRKILAQDLVNSLYALEKRGKRIADLMRGIGSLRLVTIAEKASYEEIKRAQELSEEYIALDGVHINRLIPESAALGCDFCGKQRASQIKYTGLIESRFGSFPVWASHLLEEEPVGLEGMRRLADAVYGPEIDSQSILNPLNRELMMPAEENASVQKSRPAVSEDISEEQIEAYLKSYQGGDSD
jgi:anion-transporting  ArsA/GET3 family ATPase